jgi:hypothetical protein
VVLDVVAQQFHQVHSRPSLVHKSGQECISVWFMFAWTRAGGPEEADVYAACRPLGSSIGARLSFRRNGLRGDSTSLASGCDADSVRVANLGLPFAANSFTPIART